MIFAVGNINVDWLIQDFLKLASDQNEQHEKNIDKVFKHGDGWGIAHLSNGQINTFRATEPVYDDSKIEQFKNLNTNFVILHARKASKGNVIIQNVHPFECSLNGHHYIFFHNGTIRDEITFDKRFQSVGTTDSERLFYYLLTNGNDQLTENELRSKLNSLKDFTAANFILTDGKITYASSWYAENPKYYTLKVLQKSDSVILASEVLPHYQADDWLKLENQDIVSVRTSNLSVKINGTFDG